MKNSPVPPYGVPIQDAIASGDLAKMRQVAKKAEEHLKRYGDVGRLLQDLRQEIARLEKRRRGAADIVPYGDPIRAAAASGDVERMKEMIRVAEDWLTRASDVKDALKQLKREVARRRRLGGS